MLFIPKSPSPSSPPRLALATRANPIDRYIIYIKRCTQQRTNEQRTTEQPNKQHGLAMGPKHRRRIHVANLDPAAEHFRYEVAFDVRDLISVDDVMDELKLGPNGGLVYCMEYLLQNMDWLEENLDEYDDDELSSFRCGGDMYYPCVVSCDDDIHHIPVFSLVRSFVPSASCPLSQRQHRY